MSTRLVNAAVLHHNKALVVLRNGRWIFPGNFDKHLGANGPLYLLENYFPGVSFAPLSLRPLVVSCRKSNRQGGLMRVYLSPYETMSDISSHNSDSGIDSYDFSNGEEHEFNFSPVMTSLFTALRDKKYIV